MGLKPGLPRTLPIHKIIIDRIVICPKAPETVTILLSLASETRMKTTSSISVFKTFRISSLTLSSDSNCKLNSHADTCVLGKNAYIVLDHDRAVDIIRYDKSNGTTAKNMKSISSVLAYDNQATRKMTILVVHHAIHVPTMESNLLCSVQVWMNDVKVDELTENPMDITHAISCKDGDGIQVTIQLDDCLTGESTSADPNPTFELQ